MYFVSGFSTWNTSLLNFTEFLFIHTFYSLYSLFVPILFTRGACKYLTTFIWLVYYLKHEKKSLFWHISWKYFITNFKILPIHQETLNEINGIFRFEFSSVGFLFKCTYISIPVNCRILIEEKCMLWKE